MLWCNQIFRVPGDLFTIVTINIPINCLAKTPKQCFNCDVSRSRLTGRINIDAASDNWIIVSYRSGYSQLSECLISREIYLGSKYKSKIDVMLSNCTCSVSNLMAWRLHIPWMADQLYTFVVVDDRMFLCFLQCRLYGTDRRRPNHSRCWKIFWHCQDVSGDLNCRTSGKYCQCY